MAHLILVGADGAGRSVGVGRRVAAVALPLEHRHQRQLVDARTRQVDVGAGPNHDRLVR